MPESKEPNHANHAKLRWGMLTMKYASFVVKPNHAWVTTTVWINRPD